jgi:hypothetical protein
MTRNALYENLILSLYAVRGANAAFLGALAEPLPPVPTREEWEQEGVLTVFPSKAIADLHAQIEWHERAIDEERGRTRFTVTRI